MIRTRFAAVAALIIATACGSDESPTEPTLDREVVAGTYTVMSLTFDPQGVFPEVDLLARLPASERPNLLLSKSDDAFQLVLRDPQSGFITTVPGSYALTPEGVRLIFRDDAGAQMLFLPRRAELEYDEENATLSYASQVSIPRARVNQLVPEYADEQPSTSVAGLVQIRLQKVTVVEVGV